MITSAGLLFIEPSGPASSEPVIDELTRRMAAALRQPIEAGVLAPDYKFYPGVGAKGPHLCKCGATNSAKDLRLVDGSITNRLAVHYLAHHRVEVTRDQLDIVAALPVAPVEPTQDELQSPQ